MKAGNTLDTVVTEGGPQRGPALPAGRRLDVRRRRQRAARLERGLGVHLRRRRRRGAGCSRSASPSAPGRPLTTQNYPAVGRFEGDAFDPETWKPRAPTAAYIEMRDDDAFWAARRVMAFSDELIRAVVKTGQFSDPKAEQYLADVLIKRRDKIGRAYLTEDQPDRRSRARRGGQTDVRQRGRAVRLRHRAGRLHAAGRLRQRHRRLEADRPDDGRAGRDSGAVRITRGGWRLHPRRPHGQSPGSSALERAGPGVLPSPGGRLETGRPRSVAGRACRGEAGPAQG